MNTKLADHVAGREQVLARVKQILIETLDVRREPEEIDPDTPLFGTGLRLDSLDAVELWISLGVEFRVKPPEAAGRRYTATRTLNTVVDLIMEEQGKGLWFTDASDPDPASDSASDSDLQASPDHGYEAIRLGAALSRMDHVVCLRLGGEDAFDALDLLCPADLYVRDGQILHTLLLADDGLPLADVYACCDDEAFFLLCEGPTAAELQAHIREHLPAGLNPDLEDLSQTHSVLALNGPYAWEVMAQLTGPEVVGLPYLSFYHEEQCTVFRAGKTGEFGYDLLLPRQEAQDMEQRLTEAGQRLGLDLALADIEALDQCALENWFFNIRKEGRAGVTPLDLQLQWRVSCHKDDYVGAEAIRARRELGPASRLTCVLGQEIELSTGTQLRCDQRPVGRVVNAGQLPRGGGCIGLALLDLPLAHPGIQITAVTDGGELPLVTVSPPVINNRSLFIDPQQHSARTRQVDPFPPLLQRRR